MISNTSRLLDPDLLRSVNQKALAPALAADGELETTMRLNSEYAHVTYKADAFIFCQKNGELLKEKAFVSRLKNDKTTVVALNGTEKKTKTLNSSAVWHEHPARRSYDDTGLFPNDLTSSGTSYKEGAHAHVLNLWRGFIYVPNDGECPLILKHGLEIFHQGNEETWRWDQAWHAQMLIEPHLKTHTAIVRHGEFWSRKGDVREDVATARDRPCALVSRD